MSASSYLRAAAQDASEWYDQIHAGDIETLELPCERHFDFVVCGDILEHLQDPWAVLQKLHRALKPRGTLIVSIPNIRYWRILRDLVFLGRWEYTDAGIFDSTHLRFFTRRSFLAMVRGAGFDVVFDEVWIGGKKQALASRLTFSLFQDVLGAQMMPKGVEGHLQR